MNKIEYRLENITYLLTICKNETQRQELLNERNQLLHQLRHTESMPISIR